MIGEEQRLVFYEIAVGSAMLVWINVIFIYFTAVLVFKAKKVGEFQLIRKVDEGAWTNLPRVQRSPKNALAPSKAAPQQFADSSAVSHDHGLRGVPEHAAASQGAAQRDAASGSPDLPVSPLRRRQRPPSIFLQPDDDSSSVSATGKVDVV